MTEQKLPELPSHASGVECTADDNIDRTNRDFMREKMAKIIENGALFEEGWKVATRAYKIPYRSAAHNNLEIIEPNGKMFASLDTQQINRDSGAIAGYFPGGQYAAPVLDECMKGNSVVNKENFKGEHIVFEGNGTQALLIFARASEYAAGKLSQENYNYNTFPDLEDHEVNSNALARAFAERAEGKDPYTEMVKYANVGLFNSPGLKIDILKDTDQQLPSRYDEITDPIDLIHEPELYAGFLSDLEKLHPISQQEQAIEFGKKPPENTATETPNTQSVKPL